MGLGFESESESECDVNRDLDEVDGAPTMEAMEVFLCGEGYSIENQGYWIRGGESERGETPPLISPYCSVVNSFM